MMLFLEAAAGVAASAAAAAAGAGGEHGGEAQIETGSLLHPLYVNHVVDPKLLPEQLLISLVMATIIGITCFVLTRRLDVRKPSKTQAALELIVGALQNMANGLIGPDGPRYLPVIGTLFIYILTLHLSGLIPLWKSPTANVNVTLALALATFFYIQYHGIRVNGLGGYLRHFVGEPLWMAPLNIPIHVIGELARPISLCFRLFGNIFGEDTVIAIMLMLSVMFAGIAFPFMAGMFFFGVFTSFLQAMVFTMLTCIYIAGFVAHEEGHDHEHGHAHDNVPGALDHAPLPAPPV